MTFAFTVPKPECEAVVVTAWGNGRTVSWPIRTEAEAYQLCKETKVFGFWRLKERRL